MSTAQHPSRRQVLVGGGLAAAAIPLAGKRTGPSLVRSANVAGAPPPEQVHLQFGALAATQVAVSWAAAERVRRPRLRIGRAHGHDFGAELPAQERTYTEIGRAHV